MSFALYHKIVRMMLASLCLFLTCFSQTAPFNYATIGNLVLQAEPAIKNKEAAPTKWSPYESEEPSLNDIDLAIKLPFKFEQERLTFLLLNTFSPLQGQSYIIDSEGLEALAVLSKNSSTGHCLLEKFPTQTVFGKAMAAKDLALPLSNYQALQQRQEVVMAFAHQPDLRQTIEELLCSLALQEPFILSFFDTDNKIIKKMFDSMYFKNQTHNTSIAKLAILRAYQTLDTNPALVLPRAVLNYAKTASFIKLNRVFDRYFFDMNVEMKQSTQGAITWYACFIGAALLQTAVEYAMQQFKRPIVDEALSHMKTKLLTAAEFITCVERMHTSIVNNELLRTCLPEAEAALCAFVHNKSADFLKLREILSSDTFKGKTHYLDSARILVAFKLLEQQKELFIPVLEALGSIDALSAAAKLYSAANTNSPGSYCFVTLSDGPDPKIQLENFINPLMEPKTAVVNSAHLGAGGDHNLVITGPNGSGKSVFMKSVALNLILAQSFGIVAAHTATVSLFDTFHIYLNIQENLELSLSTFMAEKKKLDAICEQIGNQQVGHKSFILIDEGLKGTVEQSGGPLIYQAGIKISQAPGTICLLATHFKKPTELEQATHGIFKNYHVELLEPQEGCFERTFKLKQEKNDWWFTDDAKRERFIAWLTEQALVL